jgi:phosphonate transport system substrate-binding protein
MVWKRKWAWWVLSVMGIFLTSLFLAACAEAVAVEETTVSEADPAGALMKCRDCNDCTSAPDCLNMNVGSPCGPDGKGECVSVKDCTTATCCCGCDMSGVPPEAVAEEVVELDPKKAGLVDGVWLGEATEIGESLDLLGESLSQVAGIEVNLEVMANYEDVFIAMESQALDFAMVPFSNYYHNREAVNVIPLLVPFYEWGGAYYQGAFVALTDAGFESLGDLAGTTFAYTTPDSFYGYHMPRAVLADQGYDINSFFASVRSLGPSPADMLYVILNQDVDAGVIWSDEITDARSVIEADVPDIWDLITIVETTPWIPNSVLIVRGDLPTETQTTIQEAFLAAAQDPSGQEALYGIHQIVDLTTPDERFWEAVEWLDWLDTLDWDLGGWPD